MFTRRRIKDLKFPQIYFTKVELESSLWPSCCNRTHQEAEVRRAVVIKFHLCYVRGCFDWLYIVYIDRSITLTLNN